jgi:hypothetical protein
VIVYASKGCLGKSAQQGCHTLWEPTRKNQK